MTAPRPGVRGTTLAVFAIALVVRFAFIAIEHGWELHATDLAGDAPEFHEIAVNVADGDGYEMRWPGREPGRGELRPTAFRAPLLPLTLAGVYAVTSPSPTTGRAFLGLVDAATAAMLVPLGALLLWRRAGIVAGLIAAVYPPLFVHVETLWSEPVFTFVVVATLLAAERFRRAPSVGSGALVGVLAGLGGLARPNGLVILVALAGWMVFILRNRLSRAELLKVVGATVAGAILVVAPWQVRTQRALGGFALVNTQGGSVLAGNFNDRTDSLDSPSWGGWSPDVPIATLRTAPDELAFDQELQRLGRRWIADHPGGAARVVGLHVVRYFDLYWSPDNRVFAHAPTYSRPLNAASVLSWWLVAGLAIAGVVALRRRRELSRVVPGILVWGALALSGIALSALTRYRVPGDPVVILLAAAFLTRRWADQVGSPVRPSRAGGRSSG